jgi:DNA-binding response OmpR family regulator
LKRIWALGRSEESDAVCGVFKSVNADSQVFLSVEALIAAGASEMPDLVVIAFDIGQKSDLAIQTIRRDSNLRSAPVLVYYPSFTSKAEMRGRLAGASDAAVLPIERRDLLARAAGLLRIDKRRTFRTLLTVEAPGRSVIAKSQDFSSSGLSFNADRSLLENEEVNIHLFLPGAGGRMRLSAVIARKVPMPDGEFQYGVRFMTNDAETLTRISEFIDRGR